jgi:hypothetical protein
MRALMWRKRQAFLLSPAPAGRSSLISETFLMAM